MNQSSFKSFKTILKGLPDLRHTLPKLHLYYGHTPAKSSPTKEPEPLADHIALVNQTALELISLHQLEYVIETLILELCRQLNFQPDLEGNFIKELFLATIVFHDFGKLNENFQSDRLQNEHFSKVDLSIGSGHSLLSTYLFINYFLERLVKIETEFTDSLAGILSAFSDPILKHHSSRYEVGDIGTDKCSQLGRFLPFIGIESQSKFLDYLLNNKRLAQETIYSSSHKPSSYPLFPLLKLNFSLLTAADYLATLSYQYDSNLPRIEDKNWWGVLSAQKKKLLHERFKESERYNEIAFLNPKKLTNKPLNQLLERSHKNLNTLRSRMLGEVILKIRQHPDAQLFYLKAPTGAGKTNISLALAIEMLQHKDGLNNIFYVFPFTTLITQTYSKIKETLGVGNNEIVQLHSKAEWNYKKQEGEQDGYFRKEWVNHVDNLFVHYPIVLLSHIRFFEILKGNSKESNYLLHRLANSVVIIDEIQSYNPRFWDHVNYYITNYARAFNIKFVVMSATLPKIGRLTTNEDHQWIELISSPNDYFQNANFANRVSFDFSLMEKKLEKKVVRFDHLVSFITKQSENYANKHNSRVKVIIEFITKKSAMEFFELAEKHPVLSQYKLLMLTGTILEPRREQVKYWLECADWLNSNPKVLLISTQVVEAGVDIDMDIGFKDSSLIDSDEQLAGRVNRNATKSGCTVYIFNLDSEGIVYQNDERLKVQKEQLNLNEHIRILEEKDFDSFYNKIIHQHLVNRKDLIRYFDNYLEHLRSLRFTEVHREFQLIKNDTVSLFIPLSIPENSFSEAEIKLLVESGVSPDQKSKISGSKIFKLYEQVIQNQSNNFIENRDSLKRIQSLLSKYTISVYPKTAEQVELIERVDHNQTEPYQYGYLYCAGYEEYYSYEGGLNLPREKLMFDFI